MLSRQSTMFKPLKVLAILLAVVIVVVHGQNSSNESTSPDDSNNNDSNQSTEASTIVNTTESPLRRVLHIFDGGLLTGILDILDAGPLGFIFKPLSLILRPIFWLVDLLLAPVWFLLRVILTPVFWILDVLLLPFHGLTSILSTLTNILEQTLSFLGPDVTLLIANVSSIVTYILGQLSGSIALQRRRRRDIMDSMMGMGWTTLTYPFRFVSDTIINMILTPLHYLYKLPMWLFHLTVGGNSGSFNSTSLATVTSYLPFSGLISALLLNLSDSSQEALIELLKFGWTNAKKTLLPAVDEFVLWAKNSTYVPDDIKSGLTAFHTGYSMLHMFGFL